jgi:exodeoxyribonuclease III
MAFRRKYSSILRYKPDILIVPECEEPAKLNLDNSDLNPANIVWVGRNSNKGLGVFSFGEFEIQLKKSFNPEFRFVIPLTVRSKKVEFDLFVVWANNPEDPDGAYIEQVWKAVHFYEKQIGRANIIIAGDFNSNSIWDRGHRIGNHSDLVYKLSRNGIQSSYHNFNIASQGEELEKTLYMYRHENKGYHIDYCFMSSDLTSRIESVRVGAYDDWIKLSDHVPLIVEISI